MTFCAPRMNLRLFQNPRIISHQALLLKSPWDSFVSATPNCEVILQRHRRSVTNCHERVNQGPDLIVTVSLLISIAAWVLNSRVVRVIKGNDECCECHYTLNCGPMLIITIECFRESSEFVSSEKRGVETDPNNLSAEQTNLQTHQQTPSIEEFPIAIIGAANKWSERDLTFIFQISVVSVFVLLPRCFCFYARSSD